MTYSRGASATKTSKSWEGSIVKSMMFTSSIECVHVFSSCLGLSKIVASKEGNSRNDIEAAARVASSVPLPYSPPTNSYTEPVGGNDSVRRCFQSRYFQFFSRSRSSFKREANGGEYDEGMRVTMRAFASSIEYCNLEDCTVILLKCLETCYSFSTRSYQHCKKFTALHDRRSCISNFSIIWHNISTGNSSSAVELKNE